MMKLGTPVAVDGPAAAAALRARDLILGSTPDLADELATAVALAANLLAGVRLLLRRPAARSRPVAALRGRRRLVGLRRLRGRRGGGRRRDGGLRRGRRGHGRAGQL